MSAYRYKFSVFKFRVRRLKRGLWDAQVCDGRWKTVVYPAGQKVLSGTRREMVAYLRYAYEGKGIA